MAINKVFWASYKGRESIVERFVHDDGRILVREYWPINEPKEHATIWDGCGLVELDRAVELTTEDENTRVLREHLESEVKRWKDAYQNLQAWCDENELDTTARNR
jgi:hypothetical protein